jgi:hypothetical protein
MCWECTVQTELCTHTPKQRDDEVVETAVYEGLQMEESDFCCDGIFI